MSLANPLPNPWIILGVVLAVAAATGYAYKAGGDNRENALMAKYEKDKNAAVEKAITDYKVQVDADKKQFADNAQKLSDARVAEARRNVKIIHEVTTNTVYTDVKCGIPPSGLQLITDAARGAAIPDSTSTGHGEKPGSTP